MSRLNENDVKQLELKVKFNIIPKTRLRRFSQHFSGYQNVGLVRSEPGQFVMTPLYGMNAEKTYRMQPRSDDVWLLSFPKCGNSNT